MFKTIDDIRKQIKEDTTTITYFLDIKEEINIKLRPELTVCYYYFDTKNIEIGLKNIGAFSGKKLTNILIHECLHYLGLSHTKRSRSLGYYAHQDRDTLTPKVNDWIFNGGTKPPELTMLLEER